MESRDEVKRHVRALLREAADAGQRLAAASGLQPGDRRALVALDVLAQLTASGVAVTPGRLAAAVGLSPAATTALVDRLAAAGLVERVRDQPDRRHVRLRLTERARTFGSEVLRPLADRVDRAADALTDAETAAVARYLALVTADPESSEAPAARPTGSPDGSDQ